MNGTITSITASDIIVKTTDGTETIPLSQVLTANIRPVRPADPAAKYTSVVLTDDTVLRCKDIAFQGKAVVLTLPSGAALKVALTSVVSFFRDAHDLTLAQQFKEIIAQKKNLDRVIFLGSTGRLTALEGSIGEVKDTTKGQVIAFTSESSKKTVDVPLSGCVGPYSCGPLFQEAPISPCAG